MTAFLERGPDALLQDYATIARRRGPTAILNHALRLQSPDFQELMARMATFGELTLSDVLMGVRPRRWNEYWRYALVATLAHQGRDANSFRQAEYVLSDGRTEQDPHISLGVAKFQAGIRFKLGMFKGVQELLDNYPLLRDIPADPIHLALLNPAHKTPYADYAAWLTGFAEFFQGFGLVPPHFAGVESTSYLDLEAEKPPSQQKTGPMVSIVVTVYKPKLDLLTHSVRSLLNQTWQNLEVIIVDDASGSEYDEVLATVSALDPRIKLIRQNVNQGTYEARNRGFRESSGEFITGHDSDDWSHPQRIERQLEPLLADPTVPGTMAHCLKVDEQMNALRVGQPHFGKCQSTLLVRREVRERIGDYLPARKAVDSEYMYRIDAFSEVPLHVIEEPLEIVLTDLNSLSGGDFGPGGWRHPARWVVRESYLRWHEIAKSRAEPLDYLKETLPYIPAGYQIKQPEPPHYDVVFAGDWQSFGGPQKSMLQEVKAHLGAGRRVAVMDLEVPRLMRKRRSGLNVPVLDLLLAGEVDYVFPDQQATSEVLILRYPPTMQFAPLEPFQVKAKSVAILANQAPSERDGSNIRYYPLDVHRNTTSCFGEEPVWIPQGPVVRSQVEGVIPDRYIAPIDFPSILSLEDWKVDRSYFRSTVPVIGRHSRDNPMKWPDSAETILAAYPDSPDYEVRSMGGTNSVSNVLGYVPERWLDLATDEMPVPKFLDGLDFYVFFPHPQAFESFGNAILEALASGLVVLLPPHFEATFGDGAVYCEPTEVTRIIDGYYSNPDRYREQSETAIRAVAERFSPNAYLRRFTQLFGQNPGA